MHNRAASLAISCFRCFMLLVGLLAFDSLSAATKPNILWLIAEDFGPHLGCYGTKQVFTPNLDQMAREGVRFSRFYTTAPVCSPSRSAFMTGMYQTTIGAHQHRTVNKKPLPEGVRLLTDWLRDAGYFTANLTKLPDSFGFRGQGKTDWNFKPADRPFDSADWADLKSHQPFYAQINFHETHRKFNGDARADPALVDIAPYYPDHAITRADQAKYLDAATELDRKIGTILKELELEGLADNTVVVFFGDNGEAHVRGKQFCYEEGLHVPLIIRWPKGLTSPKQIQPGAVDDRLLEAIDLAPTMLAVAGGAIPPQMQGRAFLGEHVAAAKSMVFGARDRCDETEMRIRTVRDARYRYIRNFTPAVPMLAPNNYKETQYPVWNLIKDLNAQGLLNQVQAALCAPRMPEEELYDLETDPWEIKNLAGSDRPEFQAALKRLRTALEEWIRDTNDQGRFPEAKPSESSVPRKKRKQKEQP